MIRKSVSFVLLLSRQYFNEFLLMKVRLTAKQFSKYPFDIFGSSFVSLQYYWFSYIFCCLMDIS